MSSHSATHSPVVLIIRDGWGSNPNAEHGPFNAIELAKTPVADDLDRNWPRTLIRTRGTDVGLPEGTMGNSEVGHQNIGAGRVVDQELMRLTRALDDGSFFDNSALNAAFEQAERTGRNMHLLGLVSNGYVHSDMEHLFGLIEIARRRGFPSGRLFVHVFTDGRDTAPTSSLGYVEQLECKLTEAGTGRIGSVIGRFFAMDRDNRWDRVAKAYRCLTSISDQPTATSAREAIERYHQSPSDPKLGSDEFIVPTIITDQQGHCLPRIGPGDSIIFFNFRGDRPREITRAFVLNDQDWADVADGGFDRGPRLERLHYCSMSRYEAGLPVTAVAFDKPEKMPAILGMHVAAAGLRQFRCAETEKYPHVTFFFNDYREEPFPGEQRGMIPSPRDVSTYDQKPEMSAAGVCDAIVQRLQSEDCEDLLVVNFANPDMVAHTGVLDAVISAVEITDACVGRLLEAGKTCNARFIITADHGNAEQMWDPDNACPHTAHTTYDVPLYVVGEGLTGMTLRDGSRLADIAPTVLSLMGLPQPAEMTGVSLLIGVPSAG